MAYTLQDMMDEYADLGEDRMIREIATILGPDNGNVGGNQNNGNNGAQPVHIPQPMANNTEVYKPQSIFFKLPFELRTSIMESSLPSYGTELRTLHRTKKQTELQLPTRITRGLTPLLQVSKSFTADLLSSILPRCHIFIQHTSVDQTLRLFQESSFLNTMEVSHGFSLLRRIELKWAPSTPWNPSKILEFCKLLSKATGLVELKVFIPVDWWKYQEIKEWKKMFGMVLMNAPGLEHIQQMRYRRPGGLSNGKQGQKLHPGWAAANLWVETEAGLLKRNYQSL